MPPMVIKRIQIIKSDDEKKNDKKTQVALPSPILRTMQNMYYFENV